MRKEPLFLFVVISTVFVSSKQLIEELYFRFLVEKAFKVLDDIGKPVNLFLLVFLYVFAWGWYFKNRIKNRYQPSDYTIVISLSLATIYIYYRFFPAKYLFLSIDYCNWLLYTDIIFFPALVFLLLCVFNFVPFRKKSEHGLTFEKDEYIENEEKDSFKRVDMAKDLALKIKLLQNKNSFGIAIIGPYGVGKTSFLKLIEKKLDQNEIIPIWFNPWFCQNPNDIVNEFFKVLELELREHIGFSNKLLKYGQELSNIDNDNVFSRGVKSIFSLTKSDPSHQELYDENDRIFDKFKKKVVVFIDDIDRLNKEEVVEVIRLIRNTAQFKKLVFVAAFDKKYVTDALEKVNKRNHLFYLEKIFQIEIPISTIDPDKLFRIFVESLSKICDNKDFEQNIDNKVVNYLKIFIKPVPVGEENYNTNETILSIKTHFNSIITNQRDSIRYLNSILFDYPKVKEEVYVKDFLLIQLLKVKFYPIYQLLYDYKELLFNVKSDENKNHYVKSYGKPNLKEYDSKKLFEEVPPFGKINLTKVIKDEKFDRFQSNIIERLLESLFPRENSYHSEGNKIKSIRFPENFSVYFSSQLFEASVSYKEFDELIVSRIVELPRKIDFILESSKSWELIKKLRNFKSFDSTEQFERINIIIFYAFQHPKTTLSYKIFYNGLLDDNILKSWPYQLSQVYKGEKDRFRYFIKELINSHSYSPYVEASGIVLGLIRNYLYEKEFEFLLSLEELQEQNLLFLKKYLDKAKEVDINCLYLYRQCFKNIVGDQKLIELLPKADEVFRNFILNNHEESYFRYLIVPASQSSNTHKKKVLVAFGEQPFYKYGDTSNREEGFQLFLKESIEKYPESEVINNFAKFYDLYKQNGYKEVDFGEEM